MCSVGQTTGLFSDASACYVGNDLRIRQCVCPITTCRATRGVYSCRLTTPLVVLSGFLLAVWIFAAGVYVYLMNTREDLEVRARQQRVKELSMDYFYSKLFGTEGSSPTTASVKMGEEL